VAILKVEEPFELSQHVDVICLPEYEKLRDSYEWEKCVATGWGKDDFGNCLKYFNIYIVLYYTTCEATS